MRSAPVLSSLSIPVYLGRKKGRQRRLLSELLYLQSDMNYTWLVWADGERVLIPRSLSYFLNRLPAEDFVKLHRQWAVNRECVGSVERGTAGYMVYLTTGERLPISRRQWRVVQARLLESGLG